MKEKVSLPRKTESRNNSQNKRKKNNPNLYHNKTASPPLRSSYHNTRIPFHFTRGGEGEGGGLSFSTKLNMSFTQPPNIQTPLPPSAQSMPQQCFHLPSTQNYHALKQKIRAGLTDRPVVVCVGGGE